jgi:hypothetical protein
MFVIGSNSTSTGYNLTRSLRFRASATAYLSRTITTNGTSTTWTYSTWVKRGTLGAAQDGFLEARVDGSNNVEIRFNSSDAFYVVAFNSGSPVLELLTTQVFRDPSAWYHIIVAVDTTQATAANRAKIYVNGTQVTALSTATYPAQNTTTYMSQTTATHNIGRWPSPTQYFDGYLAETNFIDGQALTPSSFGSTNSLTGVWQPASYTGTYGTNGFYLPFTDNSALTTASNVGLGKDFSGNGNYWATNNISITAGVTYDSMTDVPTLTSATAANFAVLNPVVPSGGTYSNANLKFVGSTAWGIARSTINLPTTGKYYFEGTVVSNGQNNTLAGSYSFLGIALNSSSPTSGSGYNGADFVVLNDTGWLNNNGTTSNAVGVGLSANDVIGVAIDTGANTFTFYRNNSSVATGTIGLTAGSSLVFVNGSYSATYGNFNVNFGQRPFTYTAPTGFVALNTYNLPTSTILKGNSVMDATLYTGTGASLSVTNTASFKPDLVWVKGRSGATDHAWYDSVRGTTKQLESNTTGAETTEATGLTAFGSAGFTVGALAQMNTSAATYVGWQWQAGQGTSSSNTNGTITSTVSVNASAGFSVVTYTATAATGTIGHGLGVAPSMIITARRSSSGAYWGVYHKSLGASQILYMQVTDAATADSVTWNATSPTSSVFSVGNSAQSNSPSSATYVAYCWTPIAGFSAFGSYTGNGSADGPFTYLGFRPKFVIIKRTNDISNWNIYDSSRSTYNVNTIWLNANLSDAESSAAAAIDFLSNGFKNREAGGGATNASGSTYIYMAFAENPLKNSLAR